MDKIKQARNKAIEAHASITMGEHTIAHVLLGDVVNLLSELDGSKPKELTDEEIGLWLIGLKKPDGTTLLGKLTGEELFALRDHIARDHGYLSPKYKEQGAEPAPTALIHEHSKPSLMVGFSEEEIERIALGRLPVELFQLNEDGKLDMPSVPPIDINSDLRAQFIDGLRYANANTRAVSIDKIMEVVMEWCCATKDAEEDLRERLMKIRP